SYIRKPAVHTDLRDYEYFIFKQLIRGNITGNLLHHILENIDFSSQQFWHKHVHAALARFMPKQLDTYKDPLVEFLQIVLNTDIMIGESVFKLAQIEREKRLNELELDFNVPV